MRRKAMLFFLLLLMALLFTQGGFLIATMEFDGRYSLGDDNYSETAVSLALKRIVTGKDEMSFRFLGSEKDLQTLIDRLDIEVVSEQNLAEIAVVYGYSPRLNRSVKVEGRDVNIQLAKRGGTITVGTPLIAGSY